MRARSDGERPSAHRRVTLACGARQMLDRSRRRTADVANCSTSAHTRAGRAASAATAAAATGGGSLLLRRKSSAGAWRGLRRLGATQAPRPSPASRDTAAGQQAPAAASSGPTQVLILICPEFCPQPPCYVSYDYTRPVQGLVTVVQLHCSAGPCASPCFAGSARRRDSVRQSLSP